MTTGRLDLARDAILAHRRRAGALDARLDPGQDALRRAAWVGLQDSMPRAAVLSIHARVAGTGPDAWEAPSLVQIWGPRFSAYVVAERDRGVFALARLPEDAKARRFAEDLADRLERFLDGRRMSYADAGRALGIQPNALRYTAATGRVLIRWEGASRPEIWTVPAPAIEPHDARRELARRHLHVCGPATPASFGEWAGIRPPAAGVAFDALAADLAAVRTPIGDGWILAADEASFRAEPPRPGGPDRPMAARLLPSGDAYTLLQGAARELLVPDASLRGEPWTSRVWPGAILLGGEIVGTWRRAGRDLRATAWRRLSPAEREAVEEEARSLPLPEDHAVRGVAWEGAASPR